MKRLPLTRGKSALVDDADFPYLSQFHWHASRSAQTSSWYARSGGRVGQWPRGTALHRVIMNALPHQWVDHANGNGLDNRRANLRIATRSQNSRNRKIQRNGSSRFKGVTFHRQTGKWRALIAWRAGGRMNYRSLGLHDTQEQAAQAYDNAAQEIFGSFARLNFPNRKDAA